MTQLLIFLTTYPGSILVAMLLALLVPLSLAVFLSWWADRAQTQAEAERQRFERIMKASRPQAAGTATSRKRVG